MKKILYTAALLAVAAGCAKEMDFSAPVEGNLVPYTFQANLEQTKAEIANDGVFSWSAGDQIAVFNTKDSKFYTFTAAAADGSFSGTAPEGASFSVAYYPASVAGTAENEVVLPDTYSQADAAAGKLFPMVADATASTLTFSHLGALLRLTVNDVPANATSLVLSSDATIAGSFTPAEVSGKQVISAGGAASSVTVALSNDAKTNLTLTLPVPTGTFNYTLSLGDGTTEMLSKGTTSAKSIARASLHKMSALTVAYPVTENKLIGRYNVNGNSYSWGTESLVSFSAVDGYWGWNKATVEVPDYYIDFKLYKENGAVYTGNSLSDGRRIVGTTIPIASDGDGSNITIYSNRSALDVYYNSELSTLFLLPAGADFVIPTTATGSDIDQYALIGWHASDNWANDFFLEGVQGQDDWRTVRIGTSGDTPHFSIKFRKNGGWSEQIGGIYDYQRKASTLCYGKTSNSADLTFYPGTSGEFDIYVKKDGSNVFALPAGTAFSIPTRKEQEDMVSFLSIIGGINGTNWSTAYPLEFASSDNHEWYTLKNAYKISGWGAMVFKIYNGGWGKGINIGWPSNLDGSIGAVNTLYPLWLRDADADIPNIQLGTNDGNVDIYIKADLSQIFTLPAGSTFAVPSN